MGGGSFVSVVGGAQEENVLVGERKVIRRNLEEIQQLSVTERVDDWFELSDVPPRKATSVSPGTAKNLLCCLAFFSILKSEQTVIFIIFSFMSSHPVVSEVCMCVFSC